jgi:hypothetical protein
MHTYIHTYAYIDTYIYTTHAQTYATLESSVEHACITANRKMKNGFVLIPTKKKIVASEKT